MGKSTSLIRNKTFDLTQATFTKPQNRFQANRWLALVGFGAGAPRTDIAASTKTAIVPLAGETDEATELMASTYSAWLDAQFADTSIVNVETNAFGQVTSGSLPLMGNLNAWWWGSAVHSTAQVRFKLAWALSQIFAMNGAAVGQGEATGFYQRLVTATQSNNTSTFRQLLSDVTYTHAMSKWLTYNNNTKAYGSAHPDENYAREILQLFTIGLKVMNMDGTYVLDSNGIPVDTYVAEDIPAFAPFFTGLRAGYEKAVLNDDGVAASERYGCYPDSGPRFGYTGAVEHESAAKTLFAYPGASKVIFPAQLAAAGAPEWLPNKAGYVITVVNANSFTFAITSGHNFTNKDVPFSYRLGNNFTGTRYDADMLWNTATPDLVTVNKTAHGLTTGTRIYALGNVKESIEFALDYVFAHPNVPPFIATALIKLLVTSNPSPDYVKRVALKFADNGNGVRGDLSAVAKAIFLDREAIVPYAVNPNNFGRYTTITDRLLRVIRAFRDDIISTYADNELSMLTANTFPYFTKPRTLLDYACCTSHYAPVYPMASSSVFNFYRPGYVPPSTKLGDLNLTAPELQLLSAEQQIMWFNLVCMSCNTTSAQYNYSLPGIGDILDPRGGWSKMPGLDLTTMALTVTAVNVGVAIVCSCTRASNFASLDGNNNYWSGGNRVVFTRRRDNKFFNYQWATEVTAGMGSGARVINIGYGASLSDMQVGDILDVAPMAIFPTAGLAYSKVRDGGGSVQHRGFPHITLFYKLANTAPATATPADAEYDAIINYLQDKLMSSAISSEIKALMISAANTVTAAESPRLTGDASVAGHYLNWVGTLQQKRARVMLAILLASPEFCIQR
jgi:uncharacterized protein (DUF1800 family)